MIGDVVDYLIDCGTSSLFGLKSQQVELKEIQAIFVIHFHADHFDGIPFFMLPKRFVLEDMRDDMSRNLAEIDHEVAYDGKIIRCG